MKIAISAESTCDLSKEIIEENDIKIIPYLVMLGDTEVFDDETVPDKIYEYVNQTKKLPKTSAINEKAYYNYFADIMRDYDAIIHITLSSEISSSHSHAVSASQKFRNVFVVDSKSLSTGIGLLVLYAKSLVETEELPAEIARMVELRVPSVQASFVIDKLTYLHKGGRCSSLSLLGANLLKIHPQILVKDGSMKSAKKYRGKMEKVIADYTKDTLEEFNNPDLSIAFVTHTVSSPEMIEIAKSALKERGFEKIIETTAGGTITSHCGENTLGILYFNDGGVKI